MRDASLRDGAARWPTDVSRLEAHAAVASPPTFAEAERLRGRQTDARQPRPRPPAVAPYAIEVGRVLARDGSEAVIEIDGRQVTAWIAIPPPAVVDAGDLAVVIGGADRWWAVGVIGGIAGPAEATLPALAAAADLTMRAPRGRITLAAPRTRIGGATASIAATTLRTTARSCLLRCHSANQWVMGTVSRTLGTLFQQVTGHYHRRSQRISGRADGPVVIKGAGIRLN